MVLAGWGAEPRVERGYDGCSANGFEIWNPVEFLTNLQQETVFHNLANLMRKDPKKALPLDL